MVQFRHMVWHKLPKVLNFVLLMIVFCHFSRDVSANCRRPVGRAAVRDGEKRCQKFHLEMTLTIEPCSNIYKNGMALNKTSLELHGIISFADRYGVYRCSHSDGRQDVTFFVFPDDCNGKN